MEDSSLEVYVMTSKTHLRPPRTLTTFPLALEWLSRPESETREVWSHWYNAMEIQVWIRTLSTALEPAFSQGGVKRGGHEIGPRRGAGTPGSGAEHAHSPAARRPDISTFGSQQQNVASQSILDEEGAEFILAPLDLQTWPWVLRTSWWVADCRLQDSYKKWW